MDIKAFRGLSGTYNVRANERDRSTPRNIECLVQFLNNTQHRFIISRRSKGQCLLDCVFKHLNLIETDFFGLKYLPQESHRQHRINTSVNNLASSTSQKCNISSHNNNNILLTKTQSLNSYDQSPSSNASLVSSSSPPQPTSTLTSTTTNNNNSNFNDRSDSPFNQNEEHISSTLTNDNPKNNFTNTNNNSDDNNDVNCATSTFIEQRWLDPTKSIRKQYKSGPPYKFYFRVKFYVSDPSKLADTTKKHLYLQLKQDILDGRLILPTSSAILLASYVLQSEVGDYRRELQDENYASNYLKLLPNQSDDIKKKVIDLHKQHKSMSSVDAEYQFLEHAAKKLDRYGVEFYEAKDFSKTDVQIGVSSNGIVVFIDNKRMSQFSWAKIVKIMFKKKIFSIHTRKEQVVACDNFIEFNLLSNQACKSFWEECVAQHSFFGLNHQPKSPPKKFFSFLNFSSRFQYSGKTEYQTMEESRKRSFSHFSRTPSKRYARRTLPIPIGRPFWSDSSNQNGEKSTRSSLDDADGPSKKFYANGNNRDDKDSSNGTDGSQHDSTNSKSDMTLADSIEEIKRRLEGYRKDLIEEFDKLSRKNEDETLNESKLSENIDKNRYRDILPYDSTRVTLQDSMTGDYINASFVDMPVPSGTMNRYIATQGPLSTTCEDFWQMVWEQNCSLIIMVTPLIEAGRVKCHKYWPDEKGEVRYGQILVKNISEKSKSATIDRTIQLVDVKSGQKRITTQIQYKAWPDHEVPEDCSDFLKLVNRVRKHRLSNPDDPIVVHCSAGIGRTGVLILMETAICIMESGEPVYPIKILQDMRKQRAMLIQTNNQFHFVAAAICKVYDQKLYKKCKKQEKTKVKPST